MIEKDTGPSAPSTAAEEPYRKSAGDDLLPARLLRGARLCLLLALCGSGYLAWISLTGGAVAGCGPGSGCNQVLASRWAYWLGFPVSLPAFGCYLCLLATTFGVPRLNTSRRQFWHLTLGALVVFAAAWFVLLQLLVIKRWCKFCLATHSCAVCAVGMLLLPHVKNLLGRNRSHGSAGLNIRKVLFSVLAAFTGLAILVAGQFVFKKRFYLVTVLSGQFVSTANQISLHGGRFTLLPDELPRIGLSSATNYVVSLFDYTCKHCRELHPLLKEAELRYRGRLSIVSLPVPLESACNSLIIRTAPDNTNACEYAELCLGVWRARPEAFREFDDWLFTGARPMPVEEARAKAYALAGKEAVDRALKSPWVARQVQTDVALYLANARSVRDARLPQLIIGDVITHGAVDSLQEVLGLLEQHTRLGRPLPGGTNTVAH